MNPPYVQLPWGGGTRILWDVIFHAIYFNPPPVGGGTMASGSVYIPPGISIHPPRGGWDDGDACEGVAVIISIHPPRGGWDAMSSAVTVTQPISIHPPRGGWDWISACRDHQARNFNPPTPWGVGPRHSMSSASSKDFNPPTPWGVGPRWRAVCWPPILFQSTHPVGGGPAKVHKISPAPFALLTKFVRYFIGCPPYRAEHPFPFRKNAAQFRFLHQIQGQPRTVPVEKPHIGIQAHALQRRNTVIGQQAKDSMALTLSSGGRRQKENAADRKAGDNPPRYTPSMISGIRPGSSSRAIS